VEEIELFIFTVSVFGLISLMYGLSASDGVPQEGIPYILAVVFTAESEK
jgi:hypothetical protein